jgi:hypothetical protein
MKHLYVYHEKDRGVLEKEHHDKDLKLKTGDHVRMKDVVDRIYILEDIKVIWDYDNEKKIHILFMKELNKDPFEDIV